MKMLHTAFLAMAVLVSGFDWAAADEPVRAPAELSLNGKVVKVIGADRIVVMKTADGKEVRLHILPDAQIMVNQKPVKLGELREGVPVRVLYTDRAGKFQVNRIETPVVVVPAPSNPPVVVPAEPAVIVPGGSVTGIVMEGDRPQPDIAVELRTQEGKVVSTTRTAPDGTFAIRNVAPATYIVYVDKIASQTKGETLVTIKSGKTLSNIVVNLIRVPIP
jgi:hypothetical protein